METVDPTASTVINFAQELEENSVAFYKKLAERFPEAKETFLFFSENSRKNKVLVTRTYQETVTDAIETGYSFRNLNMNDYAAQATLGEGMSYTDALKMAVQLEERACKFYSDVTERCSSLLATIPRAFKKVAQERGKRKLMLESMRS
jgi:rubrerythrin